MDVYCVIEFEDPLRVEAAAKHLRVDSVSGEVRRRVEVNCILVLVVELFSEDPGHFVMPVMEVKCLE